MGGTGEGNALGDGAQAIQAEISDGFVGGVNGGGIQLHPAAIWKLDEFAGGSLEAFEISGG